MTRDVCEVDSEREREGEKEREREGERWSGCSLKCEKILSGVSSKNKKKIAGITCLFQPLSPCEPASFKIHWASGDHAQSICFHFIICISCLLAFDVLIL